MSKMTSTGCIVEVSAATPATFDETGFAALTYTPIKGITNVLPFGATAANVESTPLETGEVENYKGFINWGSAGFEGDLDPDDAGVQIMIDAVEDNSTGGKAFDPHSFKVTYQTGAVRYLYGKVYSATENVGGANSMVTTSMGVNLDRRPVRVAAP